MLRPGLTFPPEGYAGAYGWARRTASEGLPRRAGFRLGSRQRNPVPAIRSSRAESPPEVPDPDSREPCDVEDRVPRSGDS